MISQKLLKELQDIIKEDYGVELQPDEITEVANTLVGTFDILRKVYSRDKQT